MSGARVLEFRSSGVGCLPLPERCSLDVSCFEESEVQEALAIAIEETLYVVALEGIEVAKTFEFERAAELRDTVKDLREKEFLFGID